MENYDYIVQQEGETDEEFAYRKYAEPGSFCAYCGCSI